MIKKPLAGVKNLHSDPLSGMLIDAWAFNEETGGTIGTRTGRRSTAVGSPVWQMGRLGKEVSFDAATQNFTSANYATAHPMLTVAVIAKSVETAVTGNNQILFHTATTAAGTYFVGNRKNNPTNNLAMTKAGVVEAISSTCVWPLNDGHYYYAAAASDGATVDFMLKGLTVQSRLVQTGVSIAGAESAGNGTYSLGSYGPDKAFSWNGTIVAIFVWRQKIPISALTEHSANVWRMFQSPNPVVLQGTASAATAGLRFNASLNGLGGSGPFFHDRLSA